MNDVAKQIVPKGAASSVAEGQEAPTTQALRRKLRNREHRLSIYQELMSLIDAGMNHSEASRQMGVGLRTVQRWLACGVFPERKHRVFPSIVDAYGPHLEKRYGEGCRNILQLWQELKDQGFEGQSSTVRGWLRQRFGPPKKALVSPLAKRSIPTGHQRIAWLMLKLSVCLQLLLTEGTLSGGRLPILNRETCQ